MTLLGKLVADGRTAFETEETPLGFGSNGFLNGMGLYHHIAPLLSNSSVDKKHDFVLPLEHPLW